MEKYVKKRRKMLIFFEFSGIFVIYFDFSRFFEQNFWTQLNQVTRNPGTKRFSIKFHLRNYDFYQNF